MRKVNKLIFISVVCFSIIISTYLVFLLQREEESKNSNNDDDFKRVIGLTTNPKGIRLTFINDFNDSVVISWFTEKNATNPKLLYSNKSDLSNYLEIKPNTTKLSTSTFFYSVELNNLLPNKTYFYQVRSYESNFREVMNFTTLANETNHIRFLIYGDSRTQRNVRNALTNKIMENLRDKFDFTILCGDIVNDGRIQGQWNNYFIDTEILNAYKQGIYVEGNHEFGEYPSIKMYDNLPMRNTYTNRYYSFNIGNIGFIILNSNGYTQGDDIQTDWLN